MNLVTDKYIKTSMDEVNQHGYKKKILGTFKIPVEEYYSKSRSFRDKVEELRDDVEDNFIRLVSSNIGSLDSRDQNAVEGISAYLRPNKSFEFLMSTLND